MEKILITTGKISQKPRIRVQTVIPYVSSFKFVFKMGGRGEFLFYLEQSTGMFHKVFFLVFLDLYANKIVNVRQHEEQLLKLETVRILAYVIISCYARSLFVLSL